MPKKKSKLVDINVIIRFLTQDDIDLAKKAEKLFRNAGNKELEIPGFILAEIVWVLLSYYELDKAEVIEKLEGILAFGKFKLNRKVLRRVIELFRTEKISFVDAYLVALGKYRNQSIVSFDKRVKKLAGKR
jgi:predicted nucleic-acid-binding protein